MANDLQKRAPSFGLLGIGCLLILWQIVSVFSHASLVPSPQNTLLALSELVQESDFWQTALVPSLWHIGLGISIAAMLGIPLGVAAGLSLALRAFLEPLRILLMSMPAIVSVVLLITWIGLGSTMVITVVALFLAPVFYLALCEGVDAIDKDLQEMMTLYNVSLSNRIRHLYLPAIWPALLPAIRLVIANGTRLTILAEVMSTSGGLGEYIEAARTYLQTDRLFALILIILFLVSVLDWMSCQIAPRKQGEVSAGGQV